MKLKITALVFGLAPFASGVTIINDTGNFSGEFQANESGFFTYSPGNWTQSGANSETERIWTFLDDYTPVITASGSNDLEVKYENTGWVLALGPDVSDTTTFDTAPEVDHVDVSTTSIVDLGQNLHTFYGTSQSGQVTVGVSGTITKTWGESETTSLELSSTTSGSYSTGISGEVKVKSLVNVGGSATSTITSSVTSKASTSRTTTASNTTTQGVNFSQTFNVTAGQTLYVYEQIKVTNEDIDVFYYADSNSDGVADSTTLEEANYEAKSGPVLGIYVDVQ
ncbi:hypothetical protein ACFFOV_03575 [Cerasicoccus arenae]